jgi:hypothetical protein
VVRRHGSAASHGWRWPAVRPVAAVGEMEEDDDGGGRREEEIRQPTMVAVVVAVARGRRREGGRRREFPGRPIKSLWVCGVSPAPHRVEYRSTRWPPSRGARVCCAWLIGIVWAVHSPTIPGHVFGPGRAKKKPEAKTSSLGPAWPDCRARNFSPGLTEQNFIGPSGRAFTKTCKKFAQAWPESLLGQYFAVQVRPIDTSPTYP